jgi:hypothetical protein
MRFKLTFKEGLNVVGTVRSIRMPKPEKPDQEKLLAEEIIKLEQLTERVTGLRLHIETVEQ